MQELVFLAAEFSKKWRQNSQKRLSNMGKRGILHPNFMPERMRGMTTQERQIAMRIRELREISDFSVEEVCEGVDVSAEEYMAYEAGEKDIPISLLLRLSAFYKVDTTTILTGEAPKLSVCAVTRKNMGVEIDRAEHYVYKNLAYNFNHRRVEPLYVTVDPGENSDMATDSHSGHEFDYVLEGALRLKVGNQEIELYPGDSAYYDSIHPHAMQAMGDVPCRFLAIVIP